MSEPTSQGPMWGAPQPPPAPARKYPKGVGRIAFGVYGLTLGIILAGAASASETPTASPSPAKTVTVAPEEPGKAKPAVEEPVEPTYDVPTPADFKGTVKILSKQCFGSAGCNVEYRVELEAIRTVHPDPDVTYEVTYQVAGDESGTQVGTTTITGDEYEVPWDESASTRSNATKLTVEVTEIEEY